LTLNKREVIYVRRARRRATKFFFENFDPEQSRGKTGYLQSIFMWYVYILRCKDKTLYVGITTNVTERVKCHNKGKASRYTRMRLPVKLIYQEPHPSKSSARKREIQLKNWSRAKKEALANTMP